ncbi:hypothetical protein HPB47_008963 [Ixodes persulcatus]|uniref:Uncharacterized protein n=1 Tax=Ixodes persulcatus TaxID=34615 RepID=A0AC60P3G0_IXOPE|nr:hypothetical protein HPB47_008963 [Ixodes persulcatus]
MDYKSWSRGPIKHSAPAEQHYYEDHQQAPSLKRDHSALSSSVKALFEGVFHAGFSALEVPPLPQSQLEHQLGKFKARLLDENERPAPTKVELIPAEEAAPIGHTGVRSPNGKHVSRTARLACSHERDTG